MNERNTRQKNLILKAVTNSCNHPTAEDIYNKVSTDLPHISLTTVYRNLNRLADQGVIMRIGMSKVPDRFDRTTERHYHIYCRHCGEMQDLPMLDYQSALDESCIGEPCHGYLVEGHQIIFEGVCPPCQKSFNK